ncbi:MAG: pyridoxamine 5'-phosphate oxidase family protein [Prolixibacteraceae bacterium]|nr:pyridoxamine 5'-phosphate oxidase family protein [Prolixibacteraceae bacterium]
MELPDKRIVRFISKHHVLTLATCSGSKPWCANCFYVYAEDENSLVFTSDYDTKHVKDVLENSNVAGSIVLETKLVGKIQGIQFRGVMTVPEEREMHKIKRAYLKRFPYAVIMNTTLWKVKINYIKMTDNRLGFGRKLIWKETVRDN